MRIGKFGRWSLQLEPNATEKTNVAEAATILLNRVPADPMVWKDLSSWAKIRLSVAVSLESSNQGISVDSALVRLLADREMQLDIDIYVGDSDNAADENAPSEPKLRIVPSK